MSRPKEPATAGRKCRVRVNFVEVKKFKYPTVYFYTVEIYNKRRQPAPKKYHDLVIAEILKTRKLGDTFPAYYGNRLYSQIDILRGNSQRKVEVKMEGDPFFVAIKYTGEIDLRNIDLGSNQPWDDKIQNTLTVLNAYINTKLRLQPKNISLSSKSNAIFQVEKDLKKREFLIYGIELLHGFFQSVRPGWDKLFLNVDTCHTTFYPHGDLFSLLPKFLKESNRVPERMSNDLDKGLSLRDIKNLSYRLKGIKFATMYNKRKYTIDSISMESANDYKFKNEEGQLISVSDYFSQCGLTLSHPKLPCVVVVKKGKDGQKKSSYFPLEVCNLVPGQKFPAENLTLAQNGDMIRKTAIDPKTRFEKIDRALREIYDHGSNEYLKSIDLEPDQKLTEMIARIIEGPNMVAGGLNGKEVKVIPKLGVWEVEKFKKGASLHNWSVVVFEDPRKLKSQDVRTAMGKFIDTLVEKGIEVTNKEPKISYAQIPVRFEEDCEFGYNDVKNAFEAGFANAKVKKDRKPQLVVCILNKKSESPQGLYATIKVLSLLEFGVLTQCLLASNLDPSVYQKLVPKLNTKLGGTNSSLVSGEINFKSKKTAMIMGADVYHPGREEKMQGFPSVASVCASMDPDAARYIARYRMNKYLNNETIETLSEMVGELLEEFEKRNGYLPDHIIFYRDGVSEVQIIKIMEEEIEVLKEFLKQLYGNQKLEEPKLTLLICQKRHHMRSIPVNKEDAHPKTGNCLTGTIIDSYIVMENEFSFCKCAVYDKFLRC
ncbi:15549_t:CDS:10 [Acaulospora colombiana]|uniref:15549_t:CDS:1 n=1 Tax=Acaulospora colombiana TaxID=27376 RepID=A0ACA9KWK3_9GLOM|nr:15549_t:CDS:10 [Acaulospora colombiana]